MENEFGTSNEDEVIVKILEQGNLQEVEVSSELALRCTKSWDHFY